MYWTTEQLIRKIRLGEDSTLELKQIGFKGARVQFPKRADLADELAAFGNSTDGTCVLGVDDRRTIQGMTPDQLDVAEAFVREICNDLIQPPLPVRIVRQELPDETGELKAVLRVDVPRSLFVHKSPGGYWHRQGSSKRELPPDMLARLFQQRSQARLIRFEEQSVPSTALEDLDKALWSRFLGPHTEAPIDTLHKIKLLTRDGQGDQRATVAGVLLASAHPETWLPGAFIEAVRYRGVVQDSNYQTDAETIVGPLDRQIRSAVSFVKRVMRHSAIKAPGRIETAQFSIRAVFEAVVNAVAHRDYSIHGSKIRLFVFDDRLELYSPGALPNSVTIDSMALRQSTRNELLTSLLARCPVEVEGTGRQFFMERRGDGVPIILRETRELTDQDAVWRLIDDAELLLTLPATPEPRRSSSED